MRNISMLGGAVMLLSGWLNAAHAEKLVADPALELTDGTIVTLQCIDNNGGDFYYLNGAAVKSESVSLDNFYVIRGMEDGGFRLQCITDRTYIGHNTPDNVGAGTIIAGDESKAVTFTAAVAMGELAYETTASPGVVNGVSTVRFTAKGTSMFLNAAPVGSTPEYKGGKGGYSIWYVKTYSPDELLQYVTPVSAPATQIVDGMLVALQCRDYNGGPDWYFNGKAVKSKYLGGSNLYRVYGNATDGMKMQRVSDGKYVGKSGDAIAMVEESSAVSFTAAIATAEGWTTKSASGADNSLTVRFTVSGTNNKLNAAQRDQEPKYAGGNGGYSIWYVYAYPPELGMGVKMAEAKSYLNRWHGAVTPAEIEAYERGVDEAVASIDRSGSLSEQFAAVDELYSVQTGLDAVDGRMVTITNMRRGQYLEVTEAGALNTSTTVSERSKWQILHPAGTEHIYLINPDSRKFINTSAAAAESDPAALEPAGNVYTNANVPGQGISLVRNNVSALNINNGTGNLLWYDRIDDDGSAWLLAPAGTLPTELEAGKYYRVRSNRGMWGADGDFAANHVNEAGTLLGINTVLEDDAVAGEAQGVALHRNGLGTLWQMADGKLVNVAADFKGAEALYGIGAEGTVTAEAQAVTVSAAGDRSVYAAAVKCDGKYLNVAADGSASLGDEAPAGKAHNDGSVFYFEEVAEAEARAMISAYVALAAEKNYMTSTDGSDRLAPLKKATAIWDASVVAKAEKYMATLESEEPTTVATANAVHEVTDEDLAKVEDYVAAAYNSAIGRTLHLRGIHSGRYMAGADGGLCVAGECGSDLSTVWVLDGTGQTGVYKLRNYSSDKKAGFNAGENAQQPWSDAGEDFMIEIPTDHWDEYEIADDNQIAFKSVASSSYLHKGNSEDERVVSWSASRHPGSQWVVSVAEGADVAVSVNKVEKYVEFGHATATLALNNTRHESHTAQLYIYRPAETVEPEEAEEEGLMLMVAASAQASGSYELLENNVELDDNGSGGFRLNGVSSLNPGTYRLSLPLGYFAVANADGSSSYSKPTDAVFTKSDNGELTGMGCVTVGSDEPAEPEYFDLQGRRVVKPVSGGIYVVRRGSAVSKIMLR